VNAIYQPKQDISNGSWYAARPLLDGTWYGEVEALTKQNAQKACDELNAQAARVLAAIED
jgi:hypothetical protein